MAWNESFTAGEGWAAPETSFTTGPSKESQSNKLYEKFTIPVTIADICNKVSVEEKVTYGDYSFSNIITVGIVQEMTEEDDSISYVLYDPEDKSKILKASQYMGTDGDSSEVRRYFEEERVQVVGKVRSFAGALNAMAFGFKDSSEDHYKAFTLEAKIAALYFTKNVPEMLRNGPVPSLVGCPAGLPQNDTALQGLKADVDVNQTFIGRLSYRANERDIESFFRGYGRIRDVVFKNGFGFVMNKTHQGAQRLYGNAASVPAHGGASINGLTGAPAAILQMLDQNREVVGEAGMGTDEMKRKLTTFSLDDIRSACQFLVAEGHAYITVDEDHLAII